MATTGEARKPYPCNVDKILNALPPDIAEEFRAWSYRRTSGEMMDYLNELREEYRVEKTTPEPKRGGCERWYRRLYPPGTEAIASMERIRRYSGVTDPLQFAESSLILTAGLIDKAIEEAKEFNPSVFYHLHNLLKEQRTAALTLHEARQITDRRKSELDAAYRMAELAQGYAKELGMDEKATLLLMDAALAKFKQEIKD